MDRMINEEVGNKKLEDELSVASWLINGTLHVNSQVGKDAAQGMVLLRIFGVDIPTQQM